MNRPFRVLVIGGGVSGLSAAHEIISSARRPVTVTLLEETKRFGGWVNTVSYQDGCTFELGPRTFRPVGLPGKATLDLISKLGLDEDVIPVTNSHPSVTKRYIYAKGKLHLLPNKLMSLLRTQEPLSKSIICSLIKEPFQIRSSSNDESIYDFCKRRIGKEITEYFVDAFCHGIYASSAKELSVAGCFPQLYKYEKDYGSLMLGALCSKNDKIESEDCPLFKKSQVEKWRMWTLRYGLQGLIDKWTCHLNQIGLKSILATPCTKLKFTDSKTVLCETTNGTMEADHVISSLSAFDLAKLLSPRQNTVKKLLDQIKSVSVAVVNLEFKGDVLPVDGFGFLVPSCESLDIMGVIFDSCVFSNKKDHTKITVMMGGSRFEDLFGSPDLADEDFIYRTALKRVQQILKINLKPLKSLVTIQKNCIPQYKVGHLDVVRTLKRSISENEIPLTLVGSSYQAVGLNDCIYNAQFNVGRMMQRYNLLS